MIPKFPEFKKLTLDDNDAVEKHNRNFPYYSDYNFTSLWGWDIGHKREISDLNGNLVIKFSDYETGEPFLSFLGIANTTETIQTLLDYCRKTDLPNELRLMPEVSVHDADTTLFSIIPDRANFDYIYLTERMASVQGNQYKSKRKAVERFVKAHPDHEFKVLDLSDPATQEYVRSITAAWRSHKGITDDDQSIAHETEAIENIFQIAGIRDLFVGVVTIDGVPCAYTIEEIVNNILSIGHFWKTAHRSHGEYEYLACKTAEYLDEREVTYWNWEQDLGIPSLRDSKVSYRPSDFLKKFTVRPLGEEGIVV